jgi:hypothetical protein
MERAPPMVVVVVVLFVEIGFVGWCARSTRWRGQREESFCEVGVVVARVIDVSVYGLSCDPGMGVGWSMICLRVVAGGRCFSGSLVCRFCSAGGQCKGDIIGLMLTSMASHPTVRSPAWLASSCMESVRPSARTNRAKPSLFPERRSAVYFAASDLRLRLSCIPTTTTLSHQSHRCIKPCSAISHAEAHSHPPALPCTLRRLCSTDEPGRRNTPKGTLYAPSYPTTTTPPSFFGDEHITSYC